MLFEQPYQSLQPAQHPLRHQQHLAGAGRAGERRPPAYCPSMASSSEGSEGSQSFRQRSHSNPALPFRTASKSRSPPASEISAASTFRQRSQSNAVTLGGPREQALRQAKEQSRRRTQSNATAHGPPSSRRPQRAQSKSPQNLTSALVVQLPIIPMDTEAVAHVGPSTSSWSSSSSLERIDVKNLKFSDHSFR